MIPTHWDAHNPAWSNSGKVLGAGAFRGRGPIGPACGAAALGRWFAPIGSAFSYVVVVVRIRDTWARGPLVRQDGK